MATLEVRSAFKSHSQRLFDALGTKTSWSAKVLCDLYLTHLNSTIAAALAEHQTLFFAALSEKKGWGRGECMRLYHEIKRNLLGYASPTTNQRRTT